MSVRPYAPALLASCLLAACLPVAAQAGSYTESALVKAVEESQPLRAKRKAEGVPAIGPEHYKTVATGEVAYGVVSVEGVAAKKSWGMAVLDVPVDDIWAAINDESMHVEFTSLTYAELVKGSACQSGRRVLQYLPIGFPGVKDRWWVTIRELNADLKAASGGRIRELVYHNAPDGSDVTSATGKAKMDEGIPIAFAKGSWFVQALDDDHTLVEYYSWVDPGGALNPRILSWFAGKTIRETLEAMEKIARDKRTKCHGA